MGKIAFIFPGQGAQTVGMGKDAFDSHAGAQDVFRAADEAIGFPLTEIVFNGPDEELKKTANTQPALLATSIALYEAFSGKGIAPDYVAGHSLGEYSALVVAGVLSFGDAVRTVRRRGEYMEEAVPGGRGAMAATLGADREALAALCASISAEGTAVEMANLNCPGQIVVSGTKEGVQKVAERGKEAGAKRVIPLEVSGPFHSSLMEPAARRLEDTLANIAFADAAVPVVANVTARPATAAADIRRLLVEQVVSPVLWEDSVVWMIGQGVDTFIEFGPGTVLAGLIKKIDKSVAVHSVNSLSSAEALLL